MNDKRYQRQISLKEFGPEAQDKLTQTCVLVVGVGGLGIPVLQYLNAMGIGTLGLVDQDVVDLTNLHRQVLFSENDLGLPKIEIAASKLKAQNSQTRIITHDTFLVRDNALDIIKDYDLVIDATDNFVTRYLINDACIILGKPFVYGAIHGFEGQVSVFNYQNGPTYRCLFPEMPAADEIPDCNENGVLGILPGIIGNLQALEAIKLITGIGKPLSGNLLIYNGLDHSMYKVKFSLVKTNREIKALAKQYDHHYCDLEYELSPKEFRDLIQRNDSIRIVDVRTDDEFQSFHLAGSLHLPLGDLDHQADQLSNGSTICLVCQSGIRSLKALHLLKAKDPDMHLVHLKGGLDAYKELVDLNQDLSRTSNLK